MSCRTSRSDPIRAEPSRADPTQADPIRSGLVRSRVRLTGVGQAMAGRIAARGRGQTVNVERDPAKKRARGAEATPPACQVKTGEPGQYRTVLISTQRQSMHTTSLCFHSRTTLTHPRVTYFVRVTVNISDIIPPTRPPPPAVISARGASFSISSSASSTSLGDRQPMGGQRRVSLFLHCLGVSGRSSAESRKTLSYANYCRETTTAFWSGSRRSPRSIRCPPWPPDRRNGAADGHDA
ncbi:unnamed protein product [Soboliphyme baturini]|uniref:KH_dom_type_1 domain-containing protein n=1 Tax=Soboliphyme baturini TaxID=241478 RepID=A0A183IQ92_9BILA|nr:unnamed protein product [Soboliphyme baturini]